MIDRPQVGDKVTIQVPGLWPLRGVVIDTDYHPLGIDDAVKIEIEEMMPVKKASQWWDLRYVRKVD